MAEAATAELTLSVTLTYKGDGVETRHLFYPDVQNFFKKLRRAGYDVRYIVCGEFGAAKGRAHWHCILFFRGKLPDVRLEWRYNWAPWEHGYVYFQKPDYAGLRYALKYAIKSLDTDQHAVRNVQMSKKPPLGYDFFMRMARDVFDVGLPLQDPEYSFATVTGKGGKVRKFWLRGRMRELFVDEFLALVNELPWDYRWPYYSEWMRDKVLAPARHRDLLLDASVFERELALRKERRDAAYKRVNEVPVKFVGGLKTRDKDAQVLRYLAIPRSKNYPPGMATVLSDGFAVLNIGDRECFEHVADLHYDTVMSWLGSQQILPPGLLAPVSEWIVGL